ncbi:MAG: hypothetical protein AB1324_07630 [Candidatus Micrarchaeota archaeon]
MQRVGWKGGPKAEPAAFTARPIVDTMSAQDIRTAVRDGGRAERLDGIARLAERIERGAVAKCEAVSILEGCLEDAEFEVRWKAALTIARHGTEMLPAIGAGLGNGDPKIRLLMSKIACAVISSNQDVCNDYASPDGRRLARAVLVAMSDSQPTVADYAFSAVAELTHRNPIIILEEAEAALGEMSGEARAIVEQAKARSVETLRALAAGNQC